jgi:hypothetical protein
MGPCTLSVASSTAEEVGSNQVSHSMQAPAAALHTCAAYSVLMLVGADASAAAVSLQPVLPCRLQVHALGHLTCMHVSLSDSAGDTKVQGSCCAEQLTLVTLKTCLLLCHAPGPVLAGCIVMMCVSTVLCTAATAVRL